MGWGNFIGTPPRRRRRRPSEGTIRGPDGGGSHGGWRSLGVGCPGGGVGGWVGVKNHKKYKNHDNKNAKNRIKQKKKH